MSGIRTGRLQWLWRGVAASLLVLLLGLISAPIAMAQGSEDDSLPACCRGDHGCSMRMHHALQDAANGGSQFAALTPHCPCTPMAPASAAAHDTLALLPTHIGFVLAAERTAAAQSTAAHRSAALQCDHARGPPTTPLA